MVWKKGRGKLGLFEPLMGDWIANEHSKERTNAKCRRSFEKTLDGKYVQLKADWFLGTGNYEDLTLFGVNAEKDICFWSFTSDGKQASGVRADVTDIHPEAIGFEAEMPSGLARQVYWPDDEEGFHWVVESKTKKGWNRFVHHHYRAVKVD
ncbi:MAG: hypothetical protein KDD67_01855 [Ignavibacteriae bacterium]|nr:hypothetical protein [Ignavibacteriota bacterium]MCB9215437.1 hypothetical protein [Ignavibacteria bacterium]